MLAKFLTDDSLNDIILKGTDGVEVPANRFLLSARSDVFHSMLLGKFQEASLPIVELGFSGSVLMAVVEYALTDNVQTLNSKKSKEFEVATEQLDLVVPLTEAAPYFNLAGLGELVLEYLETTIEKEPGMSFALLQICKLTGNSVPVVLSDKAKKWVRTTPAEAVSA
ncbi:expressed unknown protein [Seminavis robusta]|uniref:BTB domain-containing protein n=1 Tax=Seminavis robusta TaxID=568900 RepID=A0A9N8ECF2_9STRA|nr:expressed unknown protein [Seminavis robusta]|eukprot:Sro797_g203860.1 n/a (167) ;mRNA; f:21088-21588